MNTPSGGFRTSLFRTMIEDILDPNLIIEMMINGTYQRALKGDLEAVYVMGN